MKHPLTSAREIIRQHVPRIVFHVFNWTFISFIQSILLFAISAPAYIILLASTIEPDLSSADIASVAFELGLILVEYIADEQQWGKSFCPIWRGKKPQLITRTTRSLPVSKETIQGLGQGSAGI